MKAMMLEKQGHIDGSPLSLCEVEEPDPGPGEVRARVSACAVCRTDLHIIEGDLPERRMPIVPGHQVVGVVDKLGDGCARLRKGQRVGIAWLRHTDGDCKYCLSGRENLCEGSRYTGYHEHGGYAEYTTVPEDFAYELPEGFGDVEVSPLLCAGIIGYRALKRAKVPDGGKLLLVGFGSSAHIVIQIAAYRGYEVYVLTRSENHQRLSGNMGAVWAGSEAGDLPEKMNSAILFAPLGRLVPPVLEALEKGGTLSISGIHLSDIPGLNYENHLFYEKEIRSVSANTRADGRELLAEAARAKVKPQVEEYSLADANRALQDMKHSRTDGAGVLVIES